jgi:hypothetical protein
MKYKQNLRQVVLLFYLAVFIFAVHLPLYSQENAWSLVIGAADGLYGLDQSGRSQRLWSGGEVKKILSYKTGQTTSWLILTSQGILTSNNLRNWEARNTGLPVKTIKVYEGGRTSFITNVQEIKDLKIHPNNPEIMVCAFKEAVYLTRNGGRNWQNLGMPSYISNGIKSTAVATIAGELTVFCSHNIYGFYYYLPDRSNRRWEELNTGIETLETTNNPDEISDISVWISANGEQEILVSQTFRRRLYRLDWEQKRFDLLWRGAAGFGTIDSLSQAGSSLRFIQDREILEFSVPEKGRTLTQAPRQRRDLIDLMTSIPRNLSLVPICAAYLDRTSAQTNQQNDYSILNELWLLFDNSSFARDPFHIMSANKEGLYLPVNHARDRSSLAPYLATISNRNLNMVVIDMKDDYGRLRFTPQSPALNGWGRVFQPVDLEVFLRQMRDAGIYTVARIVVFKDPEMAARNNGRYAVWDSRNNKPWLGYYDTQRRAGSPPPDTANRTEILPSQDPQMEILRTYYDEQWVDPYSEEYWEYIAVLCEELCNRGFDEIQFDYIRFPTDGINLGDASYRFRSQGMDMESAILSFLRHVRGRIKAPISVDIYGANGWYRTGSRTGQEVELLAPWVDVICPMYYPSHFEQYLLAQNPPELRPYRIYYEGTQRTRVIARNKIIVRPWAQAFYLNVSYDRQYYNEDYVRRQLEGTRAAGNGGLTYWNNSGRYEDIPLP